LRLLNLDSIIFKGPKTVVQLITDSGLKSDHNRVNVLLLGIGGKGHDGPDLTDTIIFASIDKDAKDVVLVSIPRDLWAPNVSAKINHAYAYGLEDNSKGLEKARETVSLLFDMPVHYVFRVDFNGFTKAVDMVGGIDLDVEQTFVDPKYPVAGKEDDMCGFTLETEEKDGQKIQVIKDATGTATPLIAITDDNNPFTCRYETLTFRKGQTHMDGITALKFVRSRHGTNGEGSDFARSSRQQKIILAFRVKLLSTETLLNPKTIVELIQTFGESIDTDIKDEDVPLFAKLGTKIDPAVIRRVVLNSDEENGVLEFGEPQNYSGQSVLVPKGSAWTELAEYVQSEIFKLEEKKD
jgi:LCP family protein required for cell wall assembly